MQETGQARQKPSSRMLWMGRHLGYPVMQLHIVKRARHAAIDAGRLLKEMMEGSRSGPVLPGFDIGGFKVEADAGV